MAPVKVEAQIPVEVFATPNNASVDLMFFKFFETKDKTNSPWLFFNRNRVVVDYKITDSTYLPFFTSVNAFSYNTKKLKGFAPVFVGQFLNRGAYAKTGIQFAHVKSHLTMFSWFVSEIGSNPNIDYYVLLRYKPRLNDHWNWFLQGESLNIFPTDASNLQLYQRARMGLDKSAWQFGLGVDLIEIGRDGQYTSTILGGIFLRHEF